MIGFDGPGGTGDLFPKERVATISPQKVIVHSAQCSVLTHCSHKKNIHN